MSECHLKRDHFKSKSYLPTIHFHGRALSFQGGKYLFPGEMCVSHCSTAGKSWMKVVLRSARRSWNGWAKKIEIEVLRRWDSLKYFFLGFPPVVWLKEGLACIRYSHERHSFLIICSSHASKLCCARETSLVHGRGNSLTTDLQEKYTRASHDLCRPYKKIFKGSWNLNLEGAHEDNKLQTFGA